MNPHAKAAPARAALTTTGAAAKQSPVSIVDDRSDKNVHASQAAGGWLEWQHRRIMHAELEDQRLREAPPEVLTRTVHGRAVVQRRLR